MNSPIALVVWFCHLVGDAPVSNVTWLFFAFLAIDELDDIRRAVRK